MRKATKKSAPVLDLTHKDRFLQVGKTFAIFDRLCAWTFIDNPHHWVYEEEITEMMIRDKETKGHS